MTGRSTPRDRRPPPRVLVVAGGLVLTTSLVLAVLGAFRTGITTDEPIHVMRLDNFFHTGWFALDWDYPEVGSSEGPGSDGTNTFVYGPVAMLLLHGWSVLWGVEGWNQVSTTPHAYDVRHLGVVVLGTVCLLAVAALGRALLRSWRWGLVAAAVLAAVPMWTGHAMFNVKDVPVATGYTLATLGLVLLVRQRGAGRALRVGRFVALAAGLVLALGTRPGMWPGLLAVLVVAAVANWLGSEERTVALVEIAGACAAAAAALIAIYPNLFGHPVRALPGTSESSSSFLEGQKSDRLYVPRHVAEEMPTLLLIFVLTGMVVGVALLLRRWRDEPVEAGRIALVGVQAAALPVVAILMGSDLYHGLRQLLFAAPAVAVLGALGMAWWLEHVRPSRVRWVGVAAAAALVLPMIDQITLQPYQTTYANLATDLIVAPGAAPDARPGGDYWRVSIPELVNGRDVDGQLLCKAMETPDRSRALRFVNGGLFSTTRSLDCRTEPNGPLAPERLPVSPAAASAFRAVFIDRPPKSCTVEDQVTRRRHGFTIVLTSLARCDLQPSVLGTRPVTADDPALGTAADGDLWRYAVDGWEQWPGDHRLHTRGPSAAIAFRPAAPCPRGCDLEVTGDAAEGLVAHVGDSEAPLSVAAPGVLHVRLTAEQAAASGVVVVLDRPDGSPAGLRITGLSLVPAAPPGRLLEGKK